MNRNIIKASVVVGIILVIAYFGGLFPLTITGGAGWFSRGADWQYTTTDLCYGTPVDMVIPFERLGLTDDFGIESFQLWHSGQDGQSMAELVGMDPSVKVLKGSNTFSLPGSDVFQYKVGSTALWNVTFTVDPSIATKTGFCSGGSALKDGGCLIGFTACVTGGRQTGYGGAAWCSMQGTTRWSEFSADKLYSWYPASHFADGCPKPPEKVKLVPEPPSTGAVPLPEKIDKIIDAIVPGSQSPSQPPTQKEPKPIWVYVVGLGGVVVLLWWLLKRL